MHPEAPPQAPRPCPSGLTPWPLSHITPPIRAMDQSPGMMRPYVRAILAEWDMHAAQDTAELIVSELVTNVYRAAAQSAADDTPVFRLGLFTDRRALVIEVFDTVPGEPEPRAAGDDGEDGRGLMIVEALSERWGTRRFPNGKAVWARLRVDPA